MSDLPRIRRHKSGAYRQRDLDALTKSELLALLDRDSTREDLLGLWIAIDHTKNPRDIVVFPHSVDDLSEMAENIVMTNPDGTVTVTAKGGKP